MTEPADVGPSTADQLFRLIRSFWYTTHGQTAEIVDAIVAKWGTPPAVAGEPVAWLDPWTGAKVTTDYDAYGKHGIPLYTAPQPAQAQAGAVPLTDEQIDDYIRHADAGGRWGRHLRRAFDGQYGTTSAPTASASRRETAMASRRSRNRRDKRQPTPGLHRAPLMRGLFFWRLHELRFRLLRHRSRQCRLGPTYCTQR